MFQTEASNDNMHLFINKLHCECAMNAGNGFAMFKMFASGKRGRGSLCRFLASLKFPHPLAPNISTLPTPMRCIRTRHPHRLPSPPPQTHTQNTRTCACTQASTPNIKASSVLFKRQNKKKKKKTLSFFKGYWRPGSSVG